MWIFTRYGFCSIHQDPDGAFALVFRSGHEASGFCRAYNVETSDVSEPYVFRVSRKKLKRLMIDLITGEHSIHDATSVIAVTKDEVIALPEMRPKEATEPEPTNASPPPSSINPGPTKETADGYLMD